MNENRTKRRHRKFEIKGYVEKIRLLLILSISTFCLMLVLGLGSLLQAQWFTSPAYVMKGIGASVSSQFFLDMLSMEVRQLKQQDASFTFSHSNVAHFMLRFLMNINPLDPKTLLASQVPGMEHEKAILLRSGLDAGAVPPRDYAPAKSLLEPLEMGPPSTEEGVDVRDGTQEQRMADFSSLLDIVDNSKIQLGPLGSGDGLPQQLADGKRKVFIYHTHTRESFLPELEPGLKFEEAYDAKINVTLLGERLANRLNEIGIGTAVSSTDYATTVKDYNWNYSYAYSLETVKEAFAAHPGLEYYFDIHRDSGARSTTTVHIDGQDYAQVYFVIGHKNPNWQQNEQLASQIHERLERDYPGISRGVWGKQAGSGSNGEYNQSFSPNSVLIEVGGVENNLEELYRTIDVLAEVIAEIIRDAEKVDQSLNENKTAA